MFVSTTAVGRVEVRKISHSTTKDVTTVAWNGENYYTIQDIEIIF